MTSLLAQHTDDSSFSLGGTSLQYLILPACVVVSTLVLTHEVARAQEEARLILSDDGRPVLTYNAAYIPSPDEDAPWYGRSGFIHPVRTPGGRIVTEAFPEDHRHQHGLMFAWTSSVYDGRRIDFWNSHQKQGHVEHVRTVSAEADRIVVELRHLDDTNGGPVAVLHETWTVARVPHPSMHVFDLTSTQTCATDKPLLIKEYHYGAMCIRGAQSWLKSGAMVTSEGKHRPEGNHSRPDWVAMYGPVDGELCGIAAMSHPDNVHSPQHVRLHPDKPYFCFAPMVAGDFSIEPGHPLVSRFRFAAFDGEVDAELLNAVREQFVATPTAQP